MGSVAVPAPIGGTPVGPTSPSALSATRLVSASVHADATAHRLPTTFAMPPPHAAAFRSAHHPPPSQSNI
eukprot:CAMPEP_0197586966 /NCGR_PEP_ID=MMETSP1326-20131121/8760_1 /TAXON_ID=1155430 /ORGANISM="Genus nov. species nov., Strain RCC2288" /LENGTH=69 /DNA_ID=CAMNT_0043151643 /DNA_START=39 /DNA_END=245 /DNA_ORIENTATION=-